MQKAYITALYDIMKADKRVCSLLSDSGTDYDAMMASEMPGQCYNFGIAEQNKVAAASGMAAMGKIPFVYTTNAFIAYRSYEFVRDDICFQNRNVKLMGMGTGLSWSTLGVSHHTTEDIAALRALPNLTLMCASTPRQLAHMVRAAYGIDGPVYVRLGMSGEDELYPPDYPFTAGRNSLIVSGGDYTVFATGAVMGEVYQAVARLNDEGRRVQLVDVHTLKPLDTDGILSAAKGKKLLFTVEEHNVLGGLGGAVAEVLADHAAGIPLRRIGLRDAFAAGYGTVNQVRAANGLDAGGIYRQIIAQIKEKDSHDQRTSL